MAYYAGVDLGATHVRVAVADADGTILESLQTATPQGPTGIALTEHILDSLRDAATEVGIAPGRIEAVGIGSIGPLDLAAGTIENPANLPPSVGTVPLVGPISELIGTDRVYLHNDTSAGVIGERFYSDRNPDDMIYLTISTGIGAGVAIDGNVIGGWDGNAGEVGHMIVDPEGRRTCGCGRDGHWEAYCSGTNIPAYASQLAETVDGGTELPVNHPDFTAADVFAAAGEDELADLVIDRLARWNAIGLTNIINAYAPIVVYVGGAVTTNNESLILDPIRGRLDELVFANVPELRLTTLGEDVVLRGAIASALTEGTGDRARLGTRP